MEFIAHRINSIVELKQIPSNMGVELDLRDWGDRIIIQHDPFIRGEDFEEYLTNYHHGTLVLNIKSERIEFRVLELIKKYNIKRYFFLDSSFPMINSMIKAGEKNIALRFSEYEGIDTIINLAGQVNWVWVDCFNKLPISGESYKIIKDCGYKLCLVSPELQSQVNMLDKYKKFIKMEGIKFDAICTKFYNVHLWYLD